MTHAEKAQLIFDTAKAFNKRLQTDLKKYSLEYRKSVARVTASRAGIDSKFFVELIFPAGS